MHARPLLATLRTATCILNKFRVMKKKVDPILKGLKLAARLEQSKA